MERSLLWLWRGICLTLLAPLLLFNISLWTVDDGRAPVASLNKLSAALRDGAGEEMQQLFPEGYVITHGITGFAWVDAALDAPDGSDAEEHALSEARWMVAQIDSDVGREIFPANLQPAYGAFYRGYLAWLRGGILLADPTDDPAEVEQFRADCAEIAVALAASTTPYLESYPNMSWPADSVFLAASLALHDHLFTPKYEAVLTRWVGQVQSLVDPTLGLIPHSSDPATGAVSQPPRGVSSVVMSRMLHEIDPTFAADQYRRTREHFIVARGGIVAGVREYPIGTDGVGDVDSGPLFFGLSASASVVGVAAAKFQHDQAYAEPALEFLHAIGMPMLDRYGFAMFPVGEAFFAWTKSARPWAQSHGGSAAWHPVVVSGWKFIWHALSGLIAAILLLAERWLRRRGQFEASAD